MYLKQPKMSAQMKIGRALRHGSFGDATDEGTDPDVLAALHCAPGQTYDVPNQTCVNPPTPAAAPSTTSATTPSSTTTAAAQAAANSWNFDPLDPTSPYYIGGSTPVGGSSIPTILLLGAVAAGAWYLFGRDKKKGS